MNFLTPPLPSKEQGGGEGSEIKLAELVAHPGPAVCISRNCLVLEIETSLREDLSFFFLSSQQSFVVTYVSFHQHPSFPAFPCLPSSLCVCKYEGRVCLLLLLSGFAASDIISRKAVFWGLSLDLNVKTNLSAKQKKKKEEQLKSRLIKRRGSPCTCCSSDFLDLCIQIVFNCSGRFYMKIYHWSRKMQHMHY